MATGDSDTVPGIYSDLPGAESQRPLRLSQLRSDWDIVGDGVIGGGVALQALDELQDVYFFVKDRDRRFVYCNRPFLTLMCKPSFDRILGKRDEDISPLHLAEKYRKDDDMVLTTGGSIMDMVELVHNASGTFDWFTTTKYPVRDRSGDVVGVAGVTRNLSKRARQEERFFTLAPAVRHIMRHFHRPITVDELAEAVFLSRSQFGRAFKKRFSTSPHRYIAQVRLEAAGHLLCTTELPIATIASECGFYDQSHLTHEFVRHRGMTPKRFRDRNSVDHAVDARVGITVTAHHAAFGTSQ